MKRKIILFCSIWSFVLAEDFINLPKPSYKGEVSVEESIYKRKSHRIFKDGILSLKELGQLCWSAVGLTIDGITGPTRAYPSAGACYPLSVYVVVNEVNKLKEGVYKYDTRRHGLIFLKEMPKIAKKLAEVCVRQMWMQNAQVIFVITADFKKTTAWYGKRGERYVLLDAGHVGQNIHLQAEALGLGTCAIGAFDDDAVKELLDVKEDVLYIFPIGFIK